MTRTEPARAASHPQDRSGAEEVRSTLTRREQRLFLRLTYPLDFPKTPESGSGLGVEYGDIARSGARPAFPSRRDSPRSSWQVVRRAGVLSGRRPSATPVARDGDVWRRGVVGVRRTAARTPSPLAVEGGSTRGFRTGRSHCVRARQNSVGPERRDGMDPAGGAGQQVGSEEGGGAEEEGLEERHRAQHVDIEHSNRSNASGRVAATAIVSPSTPPMATSLRRTATRSRTTRGLSARSASRIPISGVRRATFRGRTRPGGHRRRSGPPSPSSRHTCWPGASVADGHASPPGLCLMLRSTSGGARVPEAPRSGLWE